MLRIPDRDLADQAKAQLEAYQAEVDAKATFGERVAEAKRLFSLRNKATNATFKVVRKTLDEMSRGARRCMYCEDSVADEVEHFRPKDFYPEMVFAWNNYLYACGPCNGGKNNRFPIISALTGKIVHLSRAAGNPVVAPETGNPALLDLRLEDPLDHLQLDLFGTFLFQPRDPDSCSLGYLRAEQVIDVLALNARDYLRRAREEAFDSYLARLDQYVTWREEGAAQEKLDRLRKSLQRMGHPTVWEEMKRQHQYLPRLQNLFHHAPEALTW